ncbi:MAG: metallopeptidase TldD-related protein, partial [Proteobacteria bacterium]|nr:metallopeptidase TldD-related protein [Pseudomonadota bacterium]
AAGFWVENGEIIYPVNGCTIAGNLRKMFSSMITADDGNQDYNVVVPSLLIDGLTIAGK